MDTLLEAGTAGKSHRTLGAGIHIVEGSHCFSLQVLPMSGRVARFAAALMTLVIFNGLLLFDSLAQAPGSFKWVYSVNGEIRSSPSVAPDGTIYFAEKGGTAQIYSITPSGTFNWSFGYSQFPYKAFGSPVIMPDGSILSGCDDGYIYNIDPSGDIIWRFNTGVTSKAGIAYDHSRGRIYACIPDGRLVCLTADGDLVWTFDSGAYFDESPVVSSEGTIFAPTRNRQGLYVASLLAISSTGSKLWEYAVEGTYRISAPSLGQQGIYFGGHSSKKVYALTYAGVLKWSFSTRGPVLSPPAIGANDQLFFGSEVWGDTTYAEKAGITPNRQLTCLTSAGKLAWAASRSHPFTTTPTIAADGTVYWSSWGITVYAFNTKGKAVWTYADPSADGFGFSAPVVGADGTIYVGTINGRLYALHGSSPIASTPWPAERHNSAHTGLQQDSAGGASTTAGVFSGLVGSAQQGLSTAEDMASFRAENGYLQITTKTDGSFSGSLRLEGKAWPIKGNFNAAGDATVSVKRTSMSNLLVMLKLDETPPGKITGTLTKSPRNLQFELYRSIYTGSSGSIHPLAGKFYTVVLPAPDVGLGHGYATITVDAKGTAKAVGMLADGMKFTTTTLLTQDGNQNWLLSIHAPLYSGAGGMINGEAIISQTPPLDTPAVTGNMGWLRPSNARAKAYQIGFLKEMAIMGEQYSFAKTISVLSGTGASAGFTQIISTTGGTQISQGGSWPSSNKPFLNSPVTPGLKLSFSGKTGVFKGKVPVVVNGKPIGMPYQGVILSRPVVLPGASSPVRGGGFFAKDATFGQIEILVP